MRTLGGKLGRSKNFGKPVTGTVKGNGQRAAQSARAVVVLGQPDRLETLKRAYGRICKDAAVGVDGVTKEQFGQNPEKNLPKLHQRIKAMKYRHQPIARVHIPNDRKQERTIGISCLEDKIVQGALTEILGVIYKQDFLDSSYGF